MDSGKFLTFDANNLSMSLRDDGNQYSIFRMQPRDKYRTEGDPIHYSVISAPFSCSLV